MHVLDALAEPADVLDGVGPASQLLPVSRFTARAGESMRSRTPRRPRFPVIGTVRLEQDLHAVVRRDPQRLVELLERS